jgi:hypothetical protein
MTKSPVALATQALRVAKAGLPTYSSHYSRKDFTQHQLFAILSLRIFFKTDYRGVIQLLHDLPDLAKHLGLKRIPHYSTLPGYGLALRRDECYAEQRLLKKGLLRVS